MRTRRYRYTYINGRSIRDFSETDVLKVASEISERRAKRVSDALSSPSVVTRYLKKTFKPADESRVVVLGLDTRHCVKDVCEIYQGLPVDLTVSTEKLITGVLTLSCSAAIIVRIVSIEEQDAYDANEVTVADKRCVKHWMDKLGILDIRALDVIIYGDNFSISCAERGLF